jgi:hypothetical protein
VSSDFDSFYLETLAVTFSFCKLVVLVRILRLLRVHTPKNVASNAFLAAKWRKQGSTQAIKCARAALISADALLAALLVTRDRARLASAPDAFFSMLAFATAFQVMAKHMLLTTQGQRRMPGCSDQLLARTTIVLHELAPAPDHPAARCAHTLDGFMATWDARLARYDAENADGAGAGADNGGVLPPPRDGMGMLHTAAAQQQALAQQLLQRPPSAAADAAAALPELGINFEAADFAGFGPDAFGAEFWLFMSELPTPASAPVPTPLPDAYPACKCLLSFVVVMRTNAQCVALQMRLRRSEAVVPAAQPAALPRSADAAAAATGPASCTLATLPPAG